MTRGLKKLSTHPLGFAWSWSFMILIFEVSDGEVKMLLWWLLLMPILTRTVAPGGPDQSGSESPVYFLNSPLVTCSALAGPRPPLYSLIYTAHRQLGAILTCLSTDLLRFAPDTFSLWGYNGKFIGITSVARSQPKSLLHFLKPFMQGRHCPTLAGMARIQTPVFFAYLTGFFGHILLFFAPVSPDFAHCVTCFWNM